MIRKLLIPIVATGLLAGCVTDYTLRGGGGGGSYYYGRPSVDYNYYGYPYGGYYPYGDRYRFGYNYGYPGYYGGYPYYYGYPRYYYPHRPHRPSTPKPPRPSDPNRDGIPWREVRPVGGGAWAPRDPGRIQQQQPRAMPAPRMAPSRPMPSAPRTNSGGQTWKQWREAQR